MRVWLQAALAGSAVACAVGLQVLVRNRLRLYLPYPFFYIAVMVSAWFAGRAAAGLAVVLGGAASTALILQSYTGPLGIHLSQVVLSFCLYLVVSVVASYCILELRAASDRADRSARVARQRMEDLRREQDRIETTLAGISDGIIRVDRASRVAYLNPVAARLAGVTVANALGLPLSEVVRVDGGLSGGRWEHLLERADRTVVPVEISRSAVPGGEGDSVITIRDLSERSRALESELRFRALADSAPVLIWMAAPDKRLDYCNRPWIEFTGCEPDDTGVAVWANCLHPDDRGRCLRDFHDSFDARRPFRFEYRLRRRDGQYRWVLDTGVPRFAPAGEFLGYVGSAVDITERREAEERFRTLVETANEGVWMVTPEGRTVYANQRMGRMLGCDAEDLRDRGVLDFCFAEDLPEGRSRIASNLAGRAECFDFRFRRMGGDEVLVLASTSPVRDAEGKVVGAVGLYSDTTERRRAISALRESEERFRQLAETIDDVFWIHDLTLGRPVYVSPAYKRLWGRSRAVLLAHPEDWLEAVHPEDRERARQILRNRQSGTPFDEEYRIVQPGGSVRWLRDRGFAVPGSGRVERMIGIAQDITSRKETEVALRASEAKLRALLESASQGVVAVDESGHILLVNAKTEEMFGYSRADLLGRRVEILLPAAYASVHEQHRLRYFEQPRTRAMGTGLYLAGRKKNGEEFPLEISLSYLREGGAGTALALITDITARQRLEEKLRETAKLESLGVLAGGIAHDFNNILTSILGNASLALDHASDQSDLRARLESVVESSERAAHLTRQMLAYAGKGRYVVEQVDLSAVLRDTVQLLQSSIPRSVELRLDLAGSLPRVEADVAQLQQLTMNLVLNAAEAMGDRPGIVSVRTRMQAVSAAGLPRNVAGNEVPPGEYVELEVRDNGVGMDEETRARMFDPFFTTKFTGRGLGLAATLGIVRGHQGAILVDSAPGKGTRITVLFPPVAQAAAAAVAAPAAFPSPICGTVLVVDDEQVVRDTAGQTLERAGLRVLLADSGEAAIRVFLTERPALVVLDMTMPVMNGEQTLERLRAIDPAVKVLLSSGYSELEAVRRFEGQQIHGFLQKPYTAARLAAAVGAVLSGETAPWPSPPPPPAPPPGPPACASGISGQPS